MTGLLAKLAEAQAAASVPAVVIPEGADHVGTIVFESLDELISGELPPPDVLVDDLLYAEGVHLASGHPSSGKSLMCLHWAHMVMAEGRHVVWLDHESGKRQTARRIKDMGISTEMVAEFFHYSPFPVQAEEHLAAVAERWPGALVILDSLSKALAALGIGENDNSEVTSWTTKVVRACKTNDLPIVIIDHITKSGTDSDYSRGAGAKLADVDVHWRVLVAEDFNRSKSGMIHLRLKKDREGYLAFESYWKVGDGKGNLTIDEASGPPSADAPENENAPTI